MFAGVAFLSRVSTAGIVYVELGFTPDAALLFAGFDQTNPNIYIWNNVLRFPSWPAALSLLVTGTTGVVTRDTTGIAVYAGGDVIAATETTDTLGKHVGRDGVAALVGHITAQGVSIPVDHQTAGALNMLWAFRNDL